MSRPGETIILRDTPPPRGAPTDTGQWFVCGLADRGAPKPTLLRSLDEFIQKFGTRQTYSILYDAIETYFREGGNQVYVSRVLGPAATIATKNLVDNVAAVSLTVTAKSAGAWGAALKVAVTVPSAGLFQLSIYDSSSGSDVLVETSPVFTTTTDAVNWGTYSTYIDVAQGASLLDPVAAAASALTGGTDDRASILDTHWQTALDRFTPDLGPGQVSFPGRTTTVAHQALLAHAGANNRVALCDAPDLDSTGKSGFIAAAAALRTDTNARFGSLWGPWVKIPGLSTSPTILRTVPYSAVQAGLIARSDASGANPNRAAAGTNGRSNSVVDTRASFNDADRYTLNEASVNLGRMMYGECRTYGYRSLVDPALLPNWRNFANSRLIMGFKARAKTIDEDFTFDQIDGPGLAFSAYGGALTGIAQDYFRKGALYGATEATAFNIDTGPSVNTPDTIAAEQIRAVCTLKCSPYGEEIVTEIVKVGTKESVA